MQGLVDGGDLGEDVDAVDVLVDHALDAAYLPFDAAQALEVGVLVGSVAVVVFCLVGCAVFFAHIFNIYPPGVYPQEGKAPNVIEIFISAGKERTYETFDYLQRPRPTSA